MGVSPMGVNAICAVPEYMLADCQVSSRKAWFWWKPQWKPRVWQPFHLVPGPATVRLVRASIA